MLNYRDKVVTITEQLRFWKWIAKLIVITLAILVIALVPLELLLFNQIVFIGLLLFAVTSVVWWIWAVINIKILLDALLQAASGIDAVNNEFVIIKLEINKIKLDHTAIEDTIAPKE